MAQPGQNPNAEIPETEVETQVSEEGTSGSVSETGFSDEQRIGPYLAEVREAQGLSIEALAKELRITDRYLAAIEAMQVGPIPRGYLTVYLRAYAGRLGLDPADIITRYTRQCGAVAEVSRPEPIAEAEPSGPSLIWPAAAGLVIVGVFAAAGGYVYGAMKGTEAAPVITASEPVNGARESLFTEAPAPMAVPSGLPLALHAVNQSWIEVRGSDGTVFRERVMAAGETYFPRVGAGWTVSAADGGAFEWRVGDVLVGTLGLAGSPVYTLSVDAAAAQAAETAAPALASTDVDASRP